MTLKSYLDSASQHVRVWFILLKQNGTLAQNQLKQIPFCCSCICIIRYLGNFELLYAFIEI